MKSTEKSMISIIVPVYQVEKYICPCVDSIIRQSYDNWELFLIDDGSTDEGGNICDEYAAKDKRICVIHQKNGGLSAARNRGLDEAKGEYIAFIDSDDILLTPEYLWELLCAAEETESNISVCGTIVFSEHDPLPKPIEMFEERKVISGREVLTGRGIGVDGYYPFACTARLFNRTCFKEIRFPSGISSEDDAVSARLLLDADRIAYSGLAMYGYRSRSDSIVHTREGRKYREDQIKIADMHRAFYISRGESELAEITETRKEYNKLMLNLLYDYRFDHERISRMFSRHFLWRLICRHDHNYNSEASKLFFGEELERVKTILDLARFAMGIGEQMPWDFIYRDIDNIISMASDEKLAVIVTKALRSYDELPASYQRRFEHFENVSIANALRRPDETTGSHHVPRYPHPWYREERDESQIYVADLFEAFLNLSADVGESTDDLNDVTKNKFGDKYNLVRGLYGKLFFDKSQDTDLSEEEREYILGMLKKHAITK